MNLRRFICSALLLSAIYTNGISEELEFTGSFWDTADSYRLLINFEKSPARLEWDGYPDNDYGRKKSAPGRITFGFDLTKDEMSLLRALMAGLPLCHNGYQSMLGTGLSHTVRSLHNGKQKYEQRYFHIEPNAILGHRMSAVPFNFQTRMKNGGLPAPERSEWFKEMSDLVSDINSWEKTLKVLADARENDTKVPWTEILSTCLNAEDLRVIDLFKKEWAFAYEVEPIVDLLLSQTHRAEYLPELGMGQVVVRIDDIYKSEIDEWITTPPPYDLGHDSDQWKIAPHVFLRLIEDFVSIKGGRFGGWNQHGFFDLVKPAEGHTQTFWERFEFIKSSNWESCLIAGKNENEPTSQLRIFTITFEDKMSKCVVLTHEEDEACFTLLQVEDAKWKILRQLDSDDWDDYGWKEPPFK